MKPTLLLMTCFIHASLMAQVPTTNYKKYSSFYFSAKEYSADIALRDAKTFVIENVIGESDEVIKFVVSPAEASKSGELMTLLYKCKRKNLQGLILGFYGPNRDELGTNATFYAFKDLPDKKAIELLNKIQAAASENAKFIDESKDKNNIFFTYDDITVLIYNTGAVTKLRIYWNGFDSDWEWSTFQRTKDDYYKMFPK
jgi:hypothetical protein